MADEQVNTAEVETSDAPAPESTGKPEGERTFTQADVNRLIAQTKSDAQKKFEAEAAEREKRAKLDTEERLRVEKEEAEKARAEAEKAARLASYRADLKGEVLDVNAALKLIDEEAHVKDGSVDIKSFLKAFPFLAPTRSTAPGAGGVQGTGQPDTSTFAGALAADGIKFG